MGVLVQVRDVPEDVHRVLKSRAARQGRSLSELIRDELAAVARRPTSEEIAARLRALPEVAAGGEDSATIIRALRDAE